MAFNLQNNERVLYSQDTMLEIYELETNIDAITTNVTDLVDMSKYSAGDKVQVPYMPNMDANVKSLNTDATGQDLSCGYKYDPTCAPELETLEVRIDSGDYLSVIFHDCFDTVKNTLNAKGETLVAGGIKALSKKIKQSALAKIKLAFTTNPTNLLGAHVVGDVAKELSALRTKMNTNGVPRDGRVVLMTSALYGELLDLHSIGACAGNVIIDNTNQEITRAYGFEIHEVSETDMGTMKIIAYHKEHVVRILDCVEPVTVRTPEQIGIHRGAQEVYGRHLKGFATAYDGKYIFGYGA